MTPDSTPRLKYFADPMCSWCWGFVPVLERLCHRLGEAVPVVPVLGGLRPHGSRPLDAATRAEIAHHWEQVRAVTGQPIVDMAALPERFVYNTRRPCEAVVAARSLDPALAQPMLRAIQAAFYTQARDVTDDNVLSELATGLGLETEAFRDALAAEANARATEADFEHTAELGIAGFPALVAEWPERRRLICLGYRDWESLEADLQRKGIL